MKNLLAAVGAISILGMGCVGVVHAPAHGGAAVKSEKKCPPGHEWSDGQCHSRGKGHDPGRKAK